MSSNHDEQPWTVLDSIRVIDRPWFKLRRDRVQLPDGTIVPEWYVTEGDGSAMIFALTPAREVVLIRIYRHPMGRWLWELPSGSFGGDGLPEAVARKELAEETGYTAKTFEAMGRFMIEPARKDGTIHYFFAADALPGPRTFTDADEAGIRTEAVPLPRLCAMLRAGEIDSGPSALALHHILTAKNL